MPPFAAPLAAVDRLEVSPRDGGLLVLASKEIVADDPYLAAHFPGQAVYPGVFVLETARQAVAAALGAGPGGLADLARVRSLRLTGVLRPGERLDVEVTVIIPPDGAAPRADGRARRADGTEVARLALEFRYPGGTGG
jgi:3-hydroxyacyl-[acyl-carrier-protein] dehydratase